MQQPQMSRFAVLSASPPATCITLVCSCTSDAGHTWHNEIRMYKAQVLYPQNLIGMIPTGGTNNCWDVLLCSMFASMYFCFKKLQSESVCKQSASPLPRIFQLNPSLHLPASLVVRAEGSAAPQTPESWWAEHGHIESWSITKHHKVRLVSKKKSCRVLPPALNKVGRIGKSFNLSPVRKCTKIRQASASLPSEARLAADASSAPAEQGMRFSWQSSLTH